MAWSDGDSGGPIYRCATGEVVGLLSTAEEGRPIVGVAPFYPPEPPDYFHKPPEWRVFSEAQAPGILNASGMGQLKIITSK